MPYNEKYRDKNGRPNWVRIHQLKALTEDRTVLEQQDMFLSFFVDVCSATIACDQADIPMTRFNNWKKNDILFREKLADAISIVTTRLEDEAVRRAYHGVLEPIFQGGKKVGVRRVYSDTILMKLLDAFAPEKYRTKNENGGGAQSTVLILPTNGRELQEAQHLTNVPQSDYIQPEPVVAAPVKETPESGHDHTSEDAIVDFPNRQE